MKAWILPVLLACIALGGWSYRVALRSQLLESSMEELVWQQAGLTFRQGKAIKSILYVRQTFIVNQRLREARRRDMAFQADVSRRFEEEKRAWQRQWATSEERRARLSAQRFNEAAWEDMIRENLLDEAWLESYLAPTTDPTEEQLILGYTHPETEGLWQTPSVWRVGHLFLAQNASETKDRSRLIQSLHQRLLQGEAWAALVNAFSEDSRSKVHGGDLGWMSEKRVVSEFSAALKKLKVGQVSQPIQTPMGWHLIQIIDYHPAKNLTLSEAKPELASWLSQSHRQERLDQCIRVGFISTRR